MNDSQSEYIKHTIRLAFNYYLEQLQSAYLVNWKFQNPDRIPIASSTEIQQLLKQSVDDFRQTILSSMDEISSTNTDYLETILALALASNRLVSNQLGQTLTRHLATSSPPGNLESTGTPKYRPDKITDLGPIDLKTTEGPL